MMGHLRHLVDVGDALGGPAQALPFVRVTYNNCNCQDG